MQDPFTCESWVQPRHRRTDDAAVVRVIGEFDLATASAAGSLDDLAALGSELAFIDSSGLGVLVTGQKRLWETGGNLAHGLRRRKHEGVEITGLTCVFAIGFESGPEISNGESRGVRGPFMGMVKREDLDVQRAETFADVAKTLLEEKGVDATLERICSTAGRMRGLKALDRVWGQIPLPQLWVGSASP